jgi:hypothetical protein
VGFGRNREKKLGVYQNKTPPNKATVRTLAHTPSKDSNESTLDLEATG